LAPTWHIRRATRAARLASGRAPAYDFTNTSDDITLIFVATCEQLELNPRMNCSRGRWKVRLNRREDVARLVQHVGLKA